MTSGASKSEPVGLESRITGLVVEGPIWAGTQEVYQHLRDMFNRKYGWVGVELPSLFGKTEIQTRDYGDYIVSGPTSQVVYRNHVLSLVLRMLPITENLRQSHIDKLSNMLFIIIKPSTEAAYNVIIKATELSKETIKAISETYTTVAKRSGLNYAEIDVDKSMSLWKQRACYSITKKMKEYPR